MKAPTVLARLVVNRANGKRMIVEVHSDATFCQFYKFYMQDGSRRSTKRQFRTANRNEGLRHINAHDQQPGLGAIAKQITRTSAAFLMRSEDGHINPVVSIKLRIFKKRAYERLLRLAPDQLGMTKLTRRDLNSQPITGIRIPAILTPSLVGVS